MASDQNTEYRPWNAQNFEMIKATLAMRQEPEDFLDDVDEEPEISFLMDGERRWSEEKSKERGKCVKHRA